MLLNLNVCLSVKLDSLPFHLHQYPFLLITNNEHSDYRNGKTHILFKQIPINDAQSDKITLELVHAGSRFR